MIFYMKKSIFVFVLAFVSIAVSAQEPKNVDGLWYTFSTDWEGNNVATVVSDPTLVGYSGDLVIPAQVEDEGTVYKVTRIGYRAFCGYANLLSVTIGNNVMYIDEHAFSYSSVTSVIIGDGVQSIGNYAFYDCERLANVVIGKDVYRIGQSAFHHCKSLSYVIIGGAPGIDQSAFYGCEKLTDIYCLSEEGTPYVWYGSIAIEESTYSNATLHCPVAAAANYESSSPWNRFAKVQKMESPELTQCATPTISYANGVVTFSCETEGVEYNSTIWVPETNYFNSSEGSVPSPSYFKVAVFASKSGCLSSETAIGEFALDDYVSVVTPGVYYKQGDVNQDGKVNVGDHVKLSDIIMNK